MKRLHNIGDSRNGTEVLALDKRKKILLLSDDLRMSSGVATISRELVMGTVHQFNWIQLGAAKKHPEQGKFYDLSEDVLSNTGVPDPYVKVLPWSGYGNMDVLRQLINMENPDAILHFTDPRYWQWLYDGEHEIRQNVPIFFYAIWDNLPIPMYNRPYYKSCDWVGAISKQTYGIVKNLIQREDYSTWKANEDWQVSYVPHGINTDTYKKVEVPQEFKERILGKGRDYDFILYWSNRNIKRKQPGDVIYAFKLFREQLPEEQRDHVALLMHTQPKDPNGTDLYKVHADLAPECNVIFSESRLDQIELNYLYNLADCTINIAGNEGFGLTTAESVMAETMMITNVTGGLQDQCGFSWLSNGELVTAEEYVKLGSLHDRDEWKYKVSWGDWVYPIWSRVRTLSGSVPTPYIWDDKVDVKEVADVIHEVYRLTPSERNERGKKGREAFIQKLGLSHENMTKQLTYGMNTAIEKWTPRKRYELFKLK